MSNLDKDHLCPVNSDTDIKHETSRARLQLFLATFICIVFITVEVAGQLKTYCFSATDVWLTFVVLENSECVTQSQIGINK